MLFIKAFHIVAVVAWFAGLFYLPRLFVYHADALDKISSDRFKIMERRLYYGIMWPSAVVTSALGIWLVSYNRYYYVHASWMHSKVFLVVLLWIYHLFCGHFLQNFAKNNNLKSTLFFRIFNELPFFLLTGIVLLVIVKPF